jgi:hypothetical protein
MVRILFCVSLAALATASHLLAGSPDAVGLKLFEDKIRPVLVRHCYACHSTEAKKLKGGLALDSREGLLEGGDSGPAVVPGKPGASLLMKAVRHSENHLKMPPQGKLDDAVITDLETWIKLGAPDPRLRASAPRIAPIV